MWKFPFNPEIAVNAMLYLCNKAQEKGVEYSFMQIAKLLFYCDKYHLKRYGRPITGDTYMSMEHGPNPSAIYAYLKNVRRQPGQKDALIRVELRENLPHNPAPYVIPLKIYDESVFSESDLEILAEVFAGLGGKSARDLRDMSHKEKAWKKADFEMDYEDFLDDEDQTIKDYINETESDWEKITDLQYNL